MAKTVALTGGTGFIGSHVARRLVAAGWRLRLLVRRLPVHPLLADYPIEAVIGSLDDTRALAELVRGADALVHCAGAIKALDRRSFERVNEAGTSAIAEAAMAEGVGRFVLMSSLAAREPQLSPYGASKRAGEAAVEWIMARNVAATDRSWVVLRPPVVYGPGDRESLAIFRGAALGIVPVLNRPDNRLSMIHVGDLARAVAAIVTTGERVNGVFEIDDGRAGGYSWRQIVEAAGAACGRPPLLVPVPAMVLRGLAPAFQAVARLTGKATILSPGKVREMCHPDWVCRPAIGLLAAGWRPAISIEVGFTETVAWYRRAAWL
jgi:nucleoside-diphosphate-sugar epimerase